MTKTPPKKNARIFAPFLTKTPAHIPQTAPNESSNAFREDFGGGGKGPSAAVVGGNPCCGSGASGVLAGERVGLELDFDPAA